MSNVAITPRTVFDIGSTSKQFTAAAIVLLALDGKLSIDDDVRKYVPELPQYQRPVTIRHLLNHTSGLRDYLTLFALKGIDDDGVTTGRDAFDVIVRQKATNFEPGSEFLYSNSGFFLLSTIVERASGRTLPEFARQRIFEPLGMTSTHFHDDHTLIVPMRATGYAPRPGGFAISMSGFEQTGDGAVMTTVEDLLKWDSNFYAPTVGGEAMLRELQTQGRLNDGKQLDYALGLFIADQRGLRTVRHGGSWAGYRAELLRFPTERTSIAVLCNLASAAPSRRADQVAAILLGDRMSPATPVASAPPRPAPSPGASAAAKPQARANANDLAGTYFAPELDAAFTVTVDSGRVAIRGAGGEAILLTPNGADSFTSEEGLGVTFVRDARRRVSGLTIDAGRVRGILAERRRTN